MKAIILAAGKGTRMGELTNDLPKPMLAVQGKPILEHIIGGIMAAGVKDFFIVTGYRAEVIEEHFGDGRKFGAKIQYGRQVTVDGTGKAPEVAKAFADTDFILTYGDILVYPQTYKDMLRRYAEGNFSGLLTCKKGEDVTKGAVLVFDKEFCLRRIIEKPSQAQLEQLRRDGELAPGSNGWYNSGVYIFKPSLFDFTAKLEKSPRGEYELTDAIAAMVAAGHRLAGVEIQGRWVDVRDPQVLASLQKGT